MNAVLIWFLLANIGFASLWMFYRLLLHRDTLFMGKRIILLLGMVFALIYPLMDASGWWNVDLQPVQSLSRNISIVLPEISVIASNHSSFNWIELFQNAYLLVVALLFFRVLTQIAQLTMLRIHNKAIWLNGLRVISLPKGSAPFSFFGLIFIHPEDHSQSDLSEILHHERTHVRQAHTVDLLLAEIICTLFWINPFVWLLKYDLRANLEFLADKDVVHAGYDPKSYQYHLLRLTYQQSPIRMGNNFNVSQLQKRIKMMNKKRTSQAGWGKYLLTLPLFAALLMVSFACKNPSEKDAKTQLSIETIGNDTVAGVDTAADIAPKPSLKSTIKFTAPKVTTDPSSVKKTLKFTAPVILSDSIYVSVDQMPEYPGGDAALIQFIKDNLHYPSVAAEVGIEGRVTIRFVVSKTGDIRDIKVIRGLDYACNEEGVRVVKLMPKWKPGMKKGIAVDVYYTLPIVYKLQK